MHEGTYTEAMNEQWDRDEYELYSAMPTADLEALYALEERVDVVEHDPILAAQAIADAHTPEDLEGTPLYSVPTPDGGSRTIYKSDYDGLLYVETTTPDGVNYTQGPYPAHIAYERTAA